MPTPDPDDALDVAPSAPYEVHVPDHLKPKPLDARHPPAHVAPLERPAPPEGSPIIPINDN